MADFIKIPKLNPIRLIKAADNFFFDDLPDFEEQINYCQKFQNSDKITLHFAAIEGAFTFTSSCVLKDVNGTVIATMLIYEKISLVVSDYTFFEVKHDLTGIAEGIYFVELTISKTQSTNVIYLSEPIWIKTTHENTILIEYSNDENEFDVVFDDTLSGAMNFQLRVEGGFGSDGFAPASKDLMYKDQSYNTVLLDSVPFFTKKLTIGNAYGVPNWIIEIVNRSLSCNIIQVDGIQYTKNESAKLEPQRPDKFYPFAGWQIELIESVNDYSQLNDDDIDNEISFYPATITDKTITNLTATYFNTHSYKIKSIDWTDLIVKIDYNINLPLFEASKLGLLAQTWQLHIKAATPLSPDNILQLKTQINSNTFEFEIITGQTQLTLETNFVVDANVSFRNPYCFYNPLVLTPVCEAAGTGLPELTRYPQTLINSISQDGYFKALNFYFTDDPSNTFNVGYSTSLDFISWTEPIKLEITQPTWADEGVDVNTFLPGQSDVIISGRHIIPIGCWTTSNNRRIGFIAVDEGFDESDFTGNQVGSIYCTDATIADTSNVEWAHASFNEFNGKYYLAVDIYTISPSTRKIYVYEVGWVSINDFTLRQIQIIEKTGVDGQYNGDNVQYPSMFVYKNQMFMTVHASENTLYIYPNLTNTNGLYVWNSDTEKFEEYFSQPVVLAPLLDTLMDWNKQHSGFQATVYDETSDKLLSLVNFTSGTDTYKIGAVELTKIAKKVVLNWYSENR